MPWLKRVIALLALASVFLLASFMGGMTHSIFAELTHGAHSAWLWGAGLLVLGLIAALTWRWSRRARLGR